MSDTNPGGAAHALVLAAGGSTRFGAAKMLADWRGEPLICTAVRVALSSPVSGVTVVLGASSNEIADALCDLDDDRLRLIVNPNWQSGLASSLRAGLDALPADAARVVVFLGDMPLVRAGLATRVLGALDKASAALPVYRGQPAHPVAFRRTAFSALEGLQGDQGARKALLSLPDAVLIETDEPGSVFDVDRPADIR